MHLWDLKANSQAIISGFTTEIPSHIAERFEALGLNQDIPITCTGATAFSGTKIFQFSSGFLALDKSAAEMINIQKLS